MKLQHRQFDITLPDFTMGPTAVERRAAALTMTRAAVRADASHDELREVLQMLELADD